jgi:hypothetical protein
MVYRKNTAQENMKIADLGEGRHNRKWPLGFHHWRVLIVQHHHMLAYPFSRSKTVPRCWCNIQEFWRWCPIFTISSGSIGRKCPAVGGKLFCCPGCGCVDCL